MSSRLGLKQLAASLQPCSRYVGIAVRALTADLKSYVGSDSAFALTFNAALASDVSNVLFSSSLSLLLSTL